jgi:hypothetical protein
MLSAREARIASGRVTRADLLGRFAPHAQGVRAPPEHERVTLLLSTDLLSEGVNLQDASVVVHLDLPWNPARLAQRLGRVRRPGGADEVFSYLMTPPAQSALLLRAEARLRAKVAQAERTIGRGLDVMPALTFEGGSCERMFSTEPCAPRPSDAEVRGRIDELLLQWRPMAATPAGRSRGRMRRENCIIAGVTSQTSGWLAALDDGRIVARIADLELDAFAPGTVAWLADDPAAVMRALQLADGATRVVTDREIASVRAEIDACLSADWAARSCGGSLVPPALRRAIRRRLDAAVRAVPRHRRAHAFALAARLRDLLDSPMPLGAERALLAHAAGEVTNRAGDKSTAATLRSPERDGERWIATALALLGGTSTHRSDARGSVIAVILLGAERSESSGER